MKIALLTTDGRTVSSRCDPAFPSFGTAPESLMQGFSALGGEAELHVISTARHRMPAPETLAPHVYFHQPMVPSWGMGKTLFAGAVLTVRNFLKELQPDIVHGQGTERDCALAAVFSGYPNVLTIHGNMRMHAKRGENKGKGYYRLAAFLESISLRKTDGVVSISSYTEELVKPLSKKTWLLPNAADSSYFKVERTPARPPVMLFVGGLDERKNPVAYIKATRDLFEENGWLLRLCGTGNEASDYFKELTKLAAHYPWIELAGWKSRDELRTEMQQASALVLPTLEDNCPMVVLEAMAVGLPVIASRVGGVPDLITNGKTGLMFDPHDPESMRKVTARMIGDSALRASVSSSAREEAERRFHPKVVAEAHLAIYREVLGKREQATIFR